jgi:hypothetical protein
MAQKIVDRKSSSVAQWPGIITHGSHGRWALRSDPDDRWWVDVPQKFMEEQHGTTGVGVPWVNPCGSHISLAQKEHTDALCIWHEDSQKQSPVKPVKSCEVELIYVGWHNSEWHRMTDMTEKSGGLAYIGMDPLLNFRHPDATLTPLTMEWPVRWSQGERVKEVALQQRFMDMTSGVHWTQSTFDQDLASLPSHLHISAYNIHLLDLTSEESANNSHDCSYCSGTGAVGFRTACGNLHQRKCPASQSTVVYWQYTDSILTVYCSMFRYVQIQKQNQWSNSETHVTGVWIRIQRQIHWKLICNSCFAIKCNPINLGLIFSVTVVTVVTVFSISKHGPMKVFGRQVSAKPGSQRRSTALCLLCLGWPRLVGGYRARLWGPATRTEESVGESQARHEGVTTNVTMRVTEMVWRCAKFWELASHWSISSYFCRYLKQVFITFHLLFSSLTLSMTPRWHPLPSPRCKRKASCNLAPNIGGRSPASLPGVGCAEQRQELTVNSPCVLGVFMVFFGGCIILSWKFMVYHNCFHTLE